MGGLLVGTALLAGGAGGGIAAQQVPASLQALAPAPLPVVDPTVAPDRSVEPVILTGADFPGWAIPQNVTAKAPFTDLADCNIPQAQQNPNDPTNTDNCSHNGYATPEVDTSPTQNKLPVKGIMPDKLLGYRWTGRRFVQIPFQVDKVFTRYLQNDASGFAFYSGADQHTTYQFDREGFRYSDSGAKAPNGEHLPRGVVGVRTVQITDPSPPGSQSQYVYVMEAGQKGPKPAYTAANGYVHYTRDPNADLFQLSQSDYSNYGNAVTGEYCDATGKLVLDANGKPTRASTWPTPPSRGSTPCCSGTRSPGPSGRSSTAPRSTRSPT